MQRSRIFLLCLILLLVLIACNRETTPQPELPPGVLYQQDFAAETNEWTLESDMDAETSIADGVLQLQINSPNLVAWAELADLKFDDFVLEVDANQVEGPDDNSYGVIFRKKKQNAFYRFDISGDGYFEFSRRNDDEANPWTSIADWTMSEAIHKGASINRIKIVAQDSHFSFYVNGQLIHEADDDSYSSGTIGLDAGAFHEAGVKITFDNLQISEP